MLSEQLIEAEKFMDYLIHTDKINTSEIIRKVYKCHNKVCFEDAVFEYMIYNIKYNLIDRFKKTCVIILNKQINTSTSNHKHKQKKDNYSEINKILYDDDLDAFIEYYYEHELNIKTEKIYGNIYNKSYVLNEYSTNMLNLIIFTGATKCFNYYLAKELTEKDNLAKKIDNSLLVLSYEYMFDIVYKAIKDEIDGDKLCDLFEYSIKYHNKHIFNKLLHNVCYRCSYIDTCIKSYNFTAMKKLLDIIDDLMIDMFIPFRHNVLFKEAIEYVLKYGHVYIPNNQYILPYIDMELFNKIVYQKRLFYVAFFYGLFEDFYNAANTLSQYNDDIKNKYKILEKTKIIVDIYDKKTSKTVKYIYHRWILEKVTHYHVSNDYLNEFNMICMKLVKNRFRHKNQIRKLKNLPITNSLKKYVRCLLHNDYKPSKEDTVIINKILSQY